MIKTLISIVVKENATRLCQEIRLLNKEHNNPSFFINYAYKVVDPNVAWFLVEPNTDMLPFLDKDYPSFSRSLYLRSLDRNLLKNPDFTCSFFFMMDESQCLKVTYKLSPEPVGYDHLISKDYITLNEDFWKLFQLLKT